MIFLAQMIKLFTSLFYSFIVESWLGSIESKVIIALDKMSIEEATSLVETISEECSNLMDRIVFKVHTLVLYEWLEWIKKLVEKSWSTVFLDGKYHDIWNTLEWYLKVISDLWMWDTIEYVTTHASNGSKWLKSAVEARDQLWLTTKILAVTALTSLDDTWTQEIYCKDVEGAVLSLAGVALESWVDGIVCSAHEAQVLREHYWAQHNFEIITPWVRLSWDDVWDQSRVTTPSKATQYWADHIVVWRPITQSDNPWDAVRRIFDDLDS